MDSPARVLCLELLSQYVSHGKLVNGTIIHRVKEAGHSPIICAFIKPILPNAMYEPEDGTVSSLRYLLHHENFIKPYSSEHLLTRLLIKSF